MTVHSRYIQGNLAYWDTHRKRLIDAIGPDVIKYDLQPGDVEGNAEAADPAGWTLTAVEVGAGTSEFRGTTTAGAVADLITAANENDGVSVQLSGESFELTSDQELYFGIEYSSTEETQLDFFFGLAITDTAILGGVTDSIGFRKADGSTSVSFIAEKDSTETEETGVLTQDTSTNHFLEFYWDGTKVEAFADGASVYYATPANLPDNEALRLSLEVLTGEAVAHTVTVRQLRIIQIGR